jgi:2'-5' RNA ligase
MRLFLGIDLPAQIKTEIANYLSPIKKSEKGWEKSHDYHQTLLFIGEVSDEDFQLINQRLHQIDFSSFHLQTSSFQFFNRRVMYLGIEKSPELLELKRQIDELFPEWSSKQTKGFHPHITVKRWQRYEHAELVGGLSVRNWTGKSFLVENVALFKSEKDEHQHKYHVVATVPLKTQTKTV